MGNLEIRDSKHNKILTVRAKSYACRQVGWSVMGAKQVIASARFGLHLPLVLLGLGGPTAIWADAAKSVYATLALAGALLILVAGSPISAQAATIPFTFEVTYDAFLGGVPSPTTLTVPDTNSGSGSFAPFGSAIYSETGTVTFAMLPSGDFVPSTVSLNFTASFNGGADTLTGTDFHVFGVSESMTILGGKGIFSGATGFAIPTTMVIAPSGNPAPNFFATLATSGSGQITAPRLNAVPEPATMTLLSTGMAGLVGVAVIRRRRQR